MELRQLEHFVAVAEEQSFTRAAERLGYVQSAVSVSIKALERELGVRLLDRTTHRVTLTDAGSQVLPVARATLTAADNVRDSAAAVRGVVRGRLRIGIMQAFAALNTARVIGQFHREHPQVNITVQTSQVGGAAELRAAVADGSLDVALAPIGATPAGVRAIPLMSEPLLLSRAREPDAAARDLTYPGRNQPHVQPVQLPSLADETFVDFPVGWAIRTAIDTAFAELGLRRRVALEVADTTTCVALIREGLGVGLLPPSFAAIAGGDLDTVPTDPPLRWEVGLLVREGPGASPAASAFVAAVEQELKPEPDRG